MNLAPANWYDDQSNPVSRRIALKWAKVDKSAEAAIRARKEAERLERTSLPLLDSQKLAGQRFTSAQVTAAVLRAFSMTRLELSAKRRNAPLVARRMVWWFMLLKHTGRSLSDVGRLTGGFDHSTVVHGRDTVKGNPDAFVDLLGAVERELEGSGQ